MSKILDEFKTFISRGNALDMAVGVIIGAAFGKIISSLVDDIIMPPLGVLIGGVDFSNLKIILKDAVMDGANVVSPEVAISYGLFINTLVNFLIIMFSIFLMLKVVNQITKKKEATPTGPTKDQELLTEIRDILKGKSKAK